MAQHNTITFAIFTILIASMFVIIAWASRRTKTSSDFLAAGRSISGPQNGLALAGDFLSTGAFLGTPGLIFLYGFDGTYVSIAGMFGFLIVLILMAERLRNAGAFTLAGALALRFPDPTLRGITALTTVVISILYLIAQMVGAGIILQALTGLSFAMSVSITGILMTIYVTFGGMLGATWIMIVKAAILIVITAVMAVAILGHAGWNFNYLVASAAESHPNGAAFTAPGLLLPPSKPLDILSYGLIYMLGTAGLPHILVRFFTVKDGKAARQSLVWALGAMAIGYTLIVTLGLGARFLFTGDAVKGASRAGGNLVTPILAGFLGGGEETLTGAIAMALIAGVALLTILAVVSGLLISASGAVAHDILANVLWRDRPKNDVLETRAAKIATVAIGAIATGLSSMIGTGFNITFILGLAYLVAATANLPVILFCLYWRRFNKTGAMTGLVGGLATSLVVIILSPVVMGNDAVIPLLYPGIISMPIGFLFCIIGTLFALAPQDAAFDSMILKTNVNFPGKIAPTVEH